MEANIKFKQLLSDASLWAVLKDDQLVGIIGIYVDDIIAAGPRKLVDEVLDMIGTMWKTSVPEVLQFGTAGEKFVFLSVCIVSVAAGYHIHQQEYVRELLKDWGMSRQRVRRT